MRLKDAKDGDKPAVCKALKRCRLGDYVEETFNTNSLFNGTIYAPEADLTINTGYTPPVTVHHHTTPGYYTPFDFIGSCFANSLTLNGAGSFHFDENLTRNSSLSRGYVVASWKEL